MASSKVLKSVLHNFLDSFSSRNSDYEGYWIFGFLVKYEKPIKINLLNENENYTEDLILNYISNFAFLLFNSIKEKQGLKELNLKMVSLELEILDETKKVELYNSDSIGNKINITVTVKTNLNKIKSLTKFIYAATHNPKAESRRSGYKS